jgi:hypothetical protein
MTGLTVYMHIDHKILEDRLTSTYTHLKIVTTRNQIRKSVLWDLSVSIRTLLMKDYTTL